MVANNNTTKRSAVGRVKLVAKALTKLPTMRKMPRGRAAGWGGRRRLVCRWQRRCVCFARGACAFFCRIVLGIVAIGASVQWNLGMHLFHKFHHGGSFCVEELVTEGPQERAKVELSWLHQYRRLPIGYECRADIHQDVLEIACILIYKCRGVLTRVGRAA